MRPAQLWPVAAVVVGALGGWCWWDRDLEPPAAAVEPAAARSVQAIDRAPAPTPPSPPPLRVATAPPPAPASGPAVFDLCGLARVSAPYGSDADVAAGGLDALPAPLGREPLAQARERMLATLRAGGPQARVAALILDKPEAADQPAVMQAWAQAVLQQARGSGDAVALSWAEEACAYLPDGAACRLGLVRARLSLEPDNGRHWAALADEDPAAADEAWRGLQQARRWSDAPQALMLATEAALPPDMPAYLRLALGAEVTTRAGTLPTPGEGFLQERCSTGPGAQHRADCGALAQLLVEHSDSLHGLVQGRKLAQLAGWSAERLERLQRELQALGQPGVHWSADSSQPLSCASVEAWQRQVDEVRAVGELAALRARAARMARAGS